MIRIPTRQNLGQSNKETGALLCAVHTALPASRGLFLPADSSLQPGETSAATPGLLLGQAGRGHVHRWTLSRGGTAEGG